MLYQNWFLANILMMKKLKLHLYLITKMAEKTNKKPGFEKYQADLKAERDRVAQLPKSEQKEYERQRRHLQKKWDKTVTIRVRQPRKQACRPVHTDR